ncbi:MAG: lipocalin-like domain-containing protein [Longimicrobiales bacterium]
MRSAVVLVTGLVALFLSSQAQGPQTEGEWNVADPDYIWEFPKDHWPHEGFKTEWWYFTGLLHEGDAQEPTLGYQFTVFKIGIVPEVPPAESEWSAANVLMGHLAGTDLASGTHRFSEVLNRAASPLAGFEEPDTPLIAWSLPPPGTEGRWELSLTETGFRFQGVDGDLLLDLRTDTASTLVFQGPGGYSRKSDTQGRASMYYSYTDLVTEGTVSLDGQTRRVAGTSWMDHEFSSNPLDEAQVGWDWFSLRLNDGRALMAFQLRDASGAPGFGHLSLVETDGSVRYLSDEEWSLSPGGMWTSPETDAAYPVSWHLSIPGSGLELEVQAVVRPQENVSERVPNLYYWEGAVAVRSPSGAPLGEGYLEMTGYGEGSRPAL